MIKIIGTDESLYDRLVNTKAWDYNLELLIVAPEKAMHKQEGYAPRFYA
ncbi:hypothetical protein EDF67_106177 [Sphingobacterium sp. JUb78]|nr:hypothetical protein [Sphingobacterium kitahiroshimense]TCR09012.1 hypothetical protein EDF67_106177 [Sphingobacterium sp. JUb78]